MSNTISDEELMLQVREGVGEMLGVLFGRYQQPLFSFFFRLTGERGSSEDLVQEVFYRILRYRHTYKPGSSFRTWLYQIARNARNDSFDRGHPERQPNESWPEPAVVPKDLIAEHQDSLLLRHALLKLPEEKRRLLLLSRFQELRYEEIGKLLGCDAGAIKVRVFRALRELKEIVQELQSRPANRLGGPQGVRYDM